MIMDRPFVCRAVALPVLGRPPSAVSTTLFKHRLTPELQDRLVQDLHSLASHLASR
jgi:hypothetical protein